MINPLIRGLSPVVQFILFLGILFICAIIGAGAAMGVGSVFFNLPLEELPQMISDPQSKHAQALIWMNNTTQLFSFLLPALLFYVLLGSKILHPLLKNTGGIMLLFAPVLILFANGLIDLSSKINHVLIPVGSSLEAMVKPSEELAEKLSHIFLQVVEAPDFSNTNHALILSKKFFQNNKSNLTAKILVTAYSNL